MSILPICYSGCPVNLPSLHHLSGFLSNCGKHTECFHLFLILQEWIGTGHQSTDPEMLCTNRETLLYTRLHVRSSHNKNNSNFPTLPLKCQYHPIMKKGTISVLSQGWLCVETDAISLFVFLSMMLFIFYHWSCVCLCVCAPTGHAQLCLAFHISYAIWYIWCTLKPWLTPLDLPREADYILMPKLSVLHFSSIDGVF